MIVTTEAVVLRTMKYRESSRIVTFFTREFGKISGIVKGARSAKNAFGSSLEPMSYVTIVLYTKEGRDLQTVTQCDVIRPMRTLKEDLEKMSVGLSVIELATITAHEEQNLPLFDLLVNVLENLHSATIRYTNALYIFELKLAEFSGFAPGFDRCSSCGKHIDERGPSVLFDLSNGGVICENCSAGGRTLTGEVLQSRTQSVRLRIETLQSLRKLYRCREYKEVFSIDISPSIKEELQHFLLTYLQRHITGMRSLKSTKVFSKILEIS